MHIIFLEILAFVIIYCSAVILDHHFIISSLIKGCENIPDVSLVIVKH